jgi:hypothetical protein
VQRKAEEDGRDDESKAREGEGGGGREGENKTGNISSVIEIQLLHGNSKKQYGKH